VATDEINMQALMSASIIPVAFSNPLPALFIRVGVQKPKKPRKQTTVKAAAVARPKLASHGVPSSPLND